MKKYLLPVFIFFSLMAAAQDPQVYEMYLMGSQSGGEDAAFVSLSDKYTLSEDPNFSAVPDVSRLPFSEAERLVLENEYKKRFFDGLKISPGDRIFIYGYANNILVTVPVKDAAVVAWLSPYAGEGDELTQYEYMIGFEFTQKQLAAFKDFSGGTLVYVGKDNPFVQGQVKPIGWQEIDKNALPVIHLGADAKEEFGRSELKYTEAQAYKYESGGYIYFVQDYSSNEEWGQGRRVLVLEAKTKKAVLDKVYVSGESTQISPINNDGSKQYTGKLFKNKPVAVFGFTYESFGCGHISFLSPGTEDLYINCDNRH